MTITEKKFLGQLLQSFGLEMKLMPWKKQMTLFMGWHLGFGPMI